ncbi:MAG: PqqD family peptide modification chaperone [Methanothrix sp.]
MISRNAILVASKEQVSCDFDGEAIILSLKTDSYYGLNAVGNFVWGIIKEPKTFDQIKEAILANYEVDPEECERDLTELVNDLLANELIQVSEEASN